MRLNQHIKSVTTFAPATVTNVSCGFDIMGFALQQPGDLVKLTRTSEHTIIIKKISGVTRVLPLDPEKNTAGKAILSMLKALNVNIGLEIEINKQMAVGTGLGSSAASAVAAVYALNQFLKKPLTKQELLPFALEGEKLTSGQHVHADNVSAALYGGFVVIRSLDPLEVLTLNYPKQLHCAIVHPQIELKTADMRDMLRQQIALKDAIQQWGNIAGLVIGLQKHNFDLISRSLNDVIVEPIRGKVIPGYQQARSAALKAGALGSGISGSGPSLFALTTSREKAKQCVQAMSKVYSKLGLAFDTYISAINDRGPFIVNIEEMK